MPLRTRKGEREYSSEQTSVIQEIKKLKSKVMILPAIKRKLRNSDSVDNSKSNSIDLLANRMGKVLKMETYRFFAEVDEISK